MTTTFLSLLVGMFLAWAVVLFIAANGANYIEHLVKQMKDKGEI